ncbi:hypothetical protein SUGI_0380600 [Cryptomeria japonica]|nr:hypothetical protein SUGI_0380600 [Cryptomeria japonica]
MQLIVIRAEHGGWADRYEEEKNTIYSLRKLYELVRELSSLSFGLPVAYVYNPLVYAWELHKQYVRNYGGRRVEVLLVGMNPGPFGMAQTGVPFGDNIIVRDFLKINGKVDSPSVTHPKRQIYGLDCPRREISGQRLWGWAEKQFHSAEKFLNRFWIHNYCPLLFMEASSKNRTPDKLPANERESLETCCNKALIATINLIQPRLVVGVGKYATKRIRASGAKDIVVGEVMHPSPANPKANKEWRNIFETQLKALGVSDQTRNLENQELGYCLIASFSLSL